jgi:polar amino acid transport system substrate-binding protein
MSLDSSASPLFAPTGRLRAAINLGNPILAGTDPATGARRRLRRPRAGLRRPPRRALELLPFDTAAKSVDAVTTESADIGFFAIDPVRGAGISFTAPYVLIEGCYLVRADSALQSAEDVDRPGVRVVVGNGSAYDLHLSRTLERAQIERAPSSPLVVETFLAQGAHVAAGVKQQLEADARRLPGLRLLDGRFMLIRQAMGTPKGRGPDAAAALHAFVEEMKSNGFISEALVRHGVDGASVAPAESLSAGGPAAPTPAERPPLRRAGDTAPPFWSAFLRTVMRTISICVPHELNRSGGNPQESPHP